MRKHIVVLTASLAACAACSPAAGPADPCARCRADGGGEERCFTEAPSTPGAPPVAVGCARLCALGPCDPGSACVDLGAERVCAPRCATSSCPARWQCEVEGGVHSSCAPVPGACSDRVPCEDPTRVCDPLALACYPSNGQCATDADCPRLDRAFGGDVVSCAQGFCHVAPVAPRQLDALRTPLDVPVAQPAPGETFASTDEVLLRWDAGGDASIALLLGDAPAPAATAGDVGRLAIWALGLPPGAVEEARPAGTGHPVSGGALQSDIVGLDARAAGPLYVLVQAVRAGALVRASALVPFRVGGSWPVAGSPCADTGTIPGACASPAAALACIDATCQPLCASHLDCAAHGTPCGATKELPGATGVLRVWYRACQ